MERFHPSQIDWTGFVNRKSTSTSQLWPPSNSSESRETTPNRSALPKSTETTMSDWQTITSPSDLSLAPPELFPDHIRSIESLRSFVKSEIGLNAIDHRMSQPVFKQAASSSATNINSEAIDIESWAKAQANRVHQSNRDVNAQQRDENTRVRNQPIAIKTAMRRGRMPKWRERYLNRCDSLKMAVKDVVGKMQSYISSLTSQM